MSEQGKNPNVETKHDESETQCLIIGDFNVLYSIGKTTSPLKIAESGVTVIRNLCRDIP